MRLKKSAFQITMIKYWNEYISFLLHIFSSLWKRFVANLPPFGCFVQSTVLAIIVQINLENKRLSFLHSCLSFDCSTIHIENTDQYLFWYYIMNFVRMTHILWVYMCFCVCLFVVMLVHLLAWDKYTNHLS